MVAVNFNKQMYVFKQTALILGGKSSHRSVKFRTKIHTRTHTHATVHTKIY